MELASGPPKNDKTALVCIILFNSFLCIIPKERKKIALLDENRP